MSARDKDTKSLQDKLKVFFNKKGPSASLPARNELLVTPELERELSSETPVHRRLRAIREVSERAIHIHIHEGGVEKIWSRTRDLLEDANVEGRHAVLLLLTNIAEGQGDRLLIMRTIFFHYLRDTHETHPAADAQLRFKLLYALTNSGKNITCFEEQIGAFLVVWLRKIKSPSHIVEFLQLIINVVKFNATYMDEEILNDIVVTACHLCVYSAEAGVVLCCLALLEAVVCYSLLPRAALPAFVAALCRTVNIEHYTQNCWKLMRYVLGADIGLAALQEMVEVLRGAAADACEAGLVRGAVFYMNMALWGRRRVRALQVSLLAVLPAFLKALEGRQAVVTYEVVVGIKILVSRVPQESLPEGAWEALLQILRRIVELDREAQPRNELIHSRLHAVLSQVEALHESGHYGGDPEALLELVDRCGHERPEASAMRLITLRCAALRPGSAPWLPGLVALADKYLRHEARLPVRLHALHAVHQHIKRHSYLYGEELVERVGVPVLGACVLDAEVGVRSAAARALTDLARGPPTAHTTDLVDLLEKILNRPFEMFVTEVPIPAEGEAGDVRLAAEGLLQLLHDKLLRSPGAHAARPLLVLLDHLDTHYKRPALFMHHPDVRIKILEMVFGLRANAFNCVGFCYDGSGAAVFGAAALRLRPLCSPFLLVEAAAGRGQQPPPPAKEPPPPACLVPLRRISRVLCAALTRETDWPVLAHVLRALPHLLQTRALAVARRAQDLDVLASTLCSMISDRSLNFPECLRASSGARPLVSEFHGAALPGLAALAPYHQFLEPQTQQRIVRCLLKYGMVLRTPQPYINALTLFTLETRETMVKMLPEVLLDLSKISDTQAIASPMLEFLSTLTRLPRVFASFVEDQYMSVFAILLPYTNPSRYNHYVVSLAHHVIAAWFLKCRLSYRRNFVRFIIHGLHNYIIMPFEEQLQYKSNYQQSANEDSSNRQRSSSLGSKAVSVSPLGRGASASASASASFHVELTETCVDLLARYTFTPCSVKPRRSDTAQFMFEGGQSTTWLVGHKLVTITTSGCQQNSIKQGLCDRCALLCKQHVESVNSPLPPLAPPHAPQAPQPPENSLQVPSGETSSTSLPQHQLQPQPQPPANNPPEVKRYSKHSLQHSRSTDTSCSSLSISEALQPPSSGHTTRQNSSENNKSGENPLMEALNHFKQRFEKISKEVDAEEAGWSRVGELVATGQCPCWCANWAEVHVRSPTGDVAWVMRMQNQMNWDHLLDSPLQDVAALLSAPLLPAAPTPSPSPSHHSSHSSGIDTRHDLTSESEGRSRSDSSSSQSRPPQDLHKSSSDSVVAGEQRRPPHAATHCIAPPQPPQARMTTQPINIPGSPQRQSSTSTTDEDDMLLIVPPSKSRHPVRRSNSSPEMSSSWKLPSARPADGDEEADERRPVLPDDMILLPGCEPTTASMTLHASKKAAKKSDMRVSCEAIPEEMSGTSPLAQHPPPPQPPQPHLMTYNSDPGEPQPTPRAAPDAQSSHLLQKTASDSIVERRASGAGAGAASLASEREELPPLSRSKRSNTISVMSPTRRHRGVPPARQPEGGGGGVAGAPRRRGSCSGEAAAVRPGGASSGGGVTPSFVFLQLYHNMSTYPITPPVPGETPTILNPLAERPLKVSGVQHERTIKNLDLVPPVETYKVGVLYVGPGQQEDEVAILRNEFGSVRYSEFLRQLGSLVSLRGEGSGSGSGSDAGELFLNLEKGGKDGDYTYVWHDDIMQVLFHVATAMPCTPADPHCNEKRKYIGNDLVSILYNDSGADFNIHTIKGQFNLCIVVVEPFDHGMNCVLVKTKDERIRGKFLAHLDAHIVSDANVALLARQLALHCALASQISQSLKVGGGGGGFGAPYASNCLERLRMIKRVRRRAEAARLAAAARAPAPYAAAPDLQRRVAIDDFNDYT